VAFLSIGTEGLIFAGSHCWSSRDLAAIGPLREAVNRRPHKRIRDYGSDDVRVGASLLVPGMYLALSWSRKSLEAVR
jgi:hypothetical protein